jgi:hypothetical protein
MATIWVVAAQEASNQFLHKVVTPLQCVSYSANDGFFSQLIQQSQKFKMRRAGFFWNCYE